jgi:hypothetical protein
MKNMPLRVLGVVALLSVALVWATSPPSAMVSWTAPSAYLDGTALPVADIDHYTLTWFPAGSTTPAGGTPGVLTVKGLTAAVPVVCGTVQFSVTATTTANAVYPNTTSTAAGPVPFVSTVSCAPNPPGALAVH